MSAMVDPKIKSDLLQSLGAFAEKLSAANADKAEKTKRRSEAILAGEQAFRKFVLPALEAVAQEIESVGAGHSAVTRASSLDPKTRNTKDAIACTLTISRMNSRELNPAPSCSFQLDENSGAVAISWKNVKGEPELKRHEAGSIEEDSVWRDVAAFLNALSDNSAS
jgi:hypothetical protein